MTQVIVRENTQVQASELLESKKDLIKRTICKGSTDEELELFLLVCKKTGLDPFMKQIYPVKRWSTTENREVMSMQTSIDGFRLIAERTGNYSPGKEPTFTYDKDGKIISATSYVKKRTSDGTWHEVAASAYFEEYVQRKKEGRPTQFWERMPHVMLSKCAESLALRKAFPAELSGIYTQDEMSQSSKEEEKPVLYKEEISEEEWAKLDSLALSISDQEYLKKLAEFVKADTLYDIQPKDYERVIRSLERKSKEKEVINEPAEVA